MLPKQQELLPACDEPMILVLISRELRWLLIFVVIYIIIFSYLVIMFGRVSNNYETSWPKW